MYDTILVPTDGSAHAVRAAGYAHRLARWFDADVQVLTVVDTRSAAGPFSAGGLSDAEREQLRDRGRERLESVEHELADGPDLHTAVELGIPAETICEVAADIDADLIAMGTHGRTGIHRYVAGSVTERVIRLAEAPVLTVRANDRSQPETGFDEVLVPTDGSDPAMSAVEPALAIAERADAQVHTVNVFDVTRDPTTLEVEPPASTIDLLREAGEAAVGKVEDRAENRGLQVTSAVLRGRPARQLLQYATENDIDLIGMGTHGRTGMSRYLMGSTTERIIRHAEIPVLAVNAPGSEATEE